LPDIVDIAQMAIVMEDVARQDAAEELAGEALGIRPERAVRQLLSRSGQSVYRIFLPGGQSVVLRIGSEGESFGDTKFNLNVLRSLGLPVQTVLASGRTRGGRAYVVLDWIAGRELIDELETMSEGEMTSAAERVVEYQQRLQRIGMGTGFGWARAGGKAPLRRWGQMFENLDGEIGAQREKLAGYFDRVRPVPFLVEMGAKNLIVEDGNIRGVVDVGHVCYGDPLMSVGAAMASIAEAGNGAGEFYAEELMQIWKADGRQREVISFYAAVVGMQIENRLQCSGA
jgi:aminoglycoside phosphotransferase (APT) family kinase protein